MSDDAGQERGKRTRYRHTQALVKIAVADGMTQVEIAKLCRTTQSEVSAWVNGKKKATEKAIRPLIKTYGHRLQREPGRVYVTRPTATAAWQSTDDGQALLGLEKHEQALDDAQLALVRRLLGDYPVELFQRIGADAELARACREELEGRQETERLAHLRGAVVFRYVARRREWTTQGRRLELAAVPSLRLIVHAGDSGRFVLVTQRRRELAGRARFRARIDALVLRNQLSDGAGEAMRRLDQTWSLASCDDDAGRWVAEIEGPLDADALLARIGVIAATQSGHDSACAPLLARKMLVERAQIAPDDVH